jgi:hypothetical protein
VKRISDAVQMPEASDLIRLTLEAETIDVAERVFQTAAAANIVLRELRREQTSLEDVFATLTTPETADEPAADVPNAQPAADASAPADSDGADSEGEAP